VKKKVFFLTLIFILFASAGFARSYNELPLPIKQGMGQIIRAYAGGNTGAFVGLWEALENGTAGQLSYFTAGQMEILLDNEGRVVQQPAHYLPSGRFFGKWVAADISGRPVKIVIPYAGDFQFALLKIGNAPTQPVAAKPAPTPPLQARLPVAPPAQVYPSSPLIPAPKAPPAPQQTTPQPQPQPAAQPQATQAYGWDGTIVEVPPVKTAEEPTAPTPKTKATKAKGGRG